MTGIINYGAGNIRSVISAVSACGEDSFLIERPGDLKKAEIIILPGVGAFADGMGGMKTSGVLEPLAEAIESGKPFLGICLGMQLLFSHSEEGDCAGLGIINGRVKKFSFGGGGLKVPHMGWNRVKTTDCGGYLFAGIPDGSYFYFAHSYYTQPDDTSITAGKTVYGAEFASAVKENNLAGVQFHPEKSGECGIRFMKNFLEGKWLR